MSNDHDSDMARLLFWFVWLSGFFLVVFLLVRFFYFSTVAGQLQLAATFFMAFLWQGFVQTTALKCYQNSARLRDAFLIQLIGTLILLLLVIVVVTIKG